MPSPPPLGAPLRRWLVVMTDDGLETHELPTTGQVTIGRDAGCDVRVDHHSVSRRHATLALGPPITVEDRGSVNGTHVAGVRAPRGQPTAVRFGDVVHVGTVALVLQQAAMAADAPPPMVMAGEMGAVHALLAAVAPGDLGVLLLGETGVGKEVSAELLHRLSPRRDRPLLKLNCGALPEALLESELFGHDKGAFSGAGAAKAGLLVGADGGTVFLDEVGELPASVQVKLLRVLEERVVRPVGAPRGRAIDVRFVAATNRDLEDAVARGGFRADLYYRLAGAIVTIPPLRARVGEIGPLAIALAAAAAGRLGQPAPAITDDALALLRAHAWPGNVRELRNAIERAVLLARGAPIGPDHLPDRLRAPPIAPTPAAAVPPAAGWWQPDAADRERARIIAALEAAGGRQAQAAELLGMSRRTLLNRLDQLAIPRPRKGRG